MFDSFLVFLWDFLEGGVGGRLQTGWCGLYGMRDVVMVSMAEDGEMAVGDKMAEDEGRW